MVTGRVKKGCKRQKKGMILEGFGRKKLVEWRVKLKIGKVEILSDTRVPCVQKRGVVGFLDHVTHFIQSKKGILLDILPSVQIARCTQFPQRGVISGSVSEGGSNVDAATIYLVRFVYNGRKPQCRQDAKSAVADRT